MLSTVGGSALVTTPGTAPWTIDYPMRDMNGHYFIGEQDHGYGGAALAVATVPPETEPLIFYATLHTHADDEAATRDMVSSLHVLDWVTGNELSVRLDGQGGRPKLYGVAGLAVGDLLDDVTDVAEELVITTLDGDLVVYDLKTGGPAGVELGARLHWSIHDGALGACNGLLILDYDGDQANELYVASTRGILKLEKQP